MNKHDHSAPQVTTKRRDILKLALAGMSIPFLRDFLWNSNVAAIANQREVIEEFDAANIKLAHRVSIRATDKDLLFLKQIGLRFVRAEVPTDAGLKELEPARDRFARAGISMISCAEYSHTSLNIQLNRNGGARDRDIETCQAVIRELGRIGIPVLVLDWLPANVYDTGYVMTARGYKVREFSVSDFQTKMEKQRFERVYSSEEMWEGFSYFLKAVLPVAEEANVKLAIHPDDPPVLEMMNGIGRIFNNSASFERAEKLAGNSRYWGIRLCVGTWAEGGEQMGKNVFEMIRDYGGRGKIFDVDFRNVSSPLPRFNETFLDDGYFKLYKVIKALREVHYNGPLVPDHVPDLLGDTGEGVGRAGLAYCIAYIRGLLNAANEEVG
jgi:mannonate dehydratase